MPPIRALGLARDIAPLGVRPMLVMSISRCAFGTRTQPVAHLPDFLPDELLIVEGTCQHRDTLAAGQKMHRQRIGIRLAAEQRELPAQPGPKQRKEPISLGPRGVIQLRKFAAQRANRAAVTFDVSAVRDQNVDKAPDAICGLFSFDFPLMQNLPRVSQTSIDYGIQDFVLGLEVKVKVAA